MASDRAALIIDESNFDVAQLASTLPLPGSIMLWALGVLDSDPDEPLIALGSLVSQIMNDISIEGLFGGESLTLADVNAEDLQGKVSEYVAWCCLLRADAFNAWLSRHREMAPVVDALINTETGTDAFGNCLVEAGLELEVGHPPIFAEDLSDALRERLVSLGEPALIFVEIRPADGIELDGFAISAPEILDLVNTRATIPPLLLALITCGYTDPYRDLLLSRREKLFDDVEKAMADLGVDDPGGFRRLDPQHCLAMFLGHIAKAQAIRRDVAREGKTIEELEQFEDLISRPVKIASDGICFSLEADPKELLRDAPDGYVGQPRGRPLFPADMMEQLEELGDLPAKVVLGTMGVELPADIGECSFSEFQDRLRISLSRITRRAAEEYLSALGWDLDIDGFEEDETLLNLDFLGYLEGRPAYVYAATTSPMDWEDTALQWCIEDFEDDLEEMPVLLAIAPLFQLQSDPKTKLLKRVIIQGGWAYDDGWKPFVLSKQGGASLESLTCVLESDRLPKAFFARHGQGKSGMDALKTLARMRYRALPEEFKGFMTDPGQGKFSYLGSTSGWLALTDEKKTDRLRGLFG